MLIPISLTYLKQTLHKVATDHTPLNPTAGKAKQMALAIQRVAFISLSNAGIFELGLVGKVTHRYCKFSSEHLDVLLKPENSISQQKLEQQMFTLARAMLTDLCSAQIFLGMSENMLSVWKETPEDTKKVWMNQCSIEDAFFLPPAIYEKLIEHYPQKYITPYVLIVNFNEAESSSARVIGTFSKLFLTNQQLKISNLVVSLINFSKTIVLTKIQPLRDSGHDSYLVTFDTTLRESFLKSIQALDFKQKEEIIQSGNTFIDSLYMSAIHMIFPELFGNPSDPLASICIISLPRESVEAKVQNS